jgi:hypothetical protein
MIINKIIADFQVLIQQTLEQRLKAIALNPDIEPSIEQDTSEITQGNYPHIFKQWSFISVENEHTLKLIRLMTTQTMRGVQENFPIDEGGWHKYQAIELNNNDGLILYGLNNVTISGMPQFINGIREVYRSDFSFKGNEAQRLYDACDILLDQFRAQMLALDVHRNPQFLFNIRNRNPDLLDFPCLQREIAIAFKNNTLTAPKNKTGKKTELTQDMIDLYSKVYEYRDQGKTLEQACVETIDNYAHLLPGDWQSQSPEETLKKLVIRLDNASALISIKKERQFYKKTA